MSKYFRYFPTTQHDLTNIGQKVDLTNILRRFKIESSLKSQAQVYHEYSLQAGDRPDTIAHKYYGDSGYAWLVLMFNEIHDPIFEWPLFNTDFDDYIKGKYGSIASAQATVHEYRKVLAEKQVKYDGTIVPKRTVVIDSTTYSSLSESERESVSEYDWEVEQNELKRQIRLVDKRYVPQIRNEVKNILRNGI